MRYTKFRFRNFKGIDDLTIDLDGDVSTLIGLNESGKTTILEAIFCFSYGAEDLAVINPSMTSLRIPEQWIPISRRANFNDTIEIVAWVELSDQDKQAYGQHLKNKFELSLSSIPSVIEIEEKYRYRDSRHIDTKKLWNIALEGTQGRQRTARAYHDAGAPEWQGAVDYLKGSLPRIWYFPNFLFELPERFALTTDDAPSGDEETDKSRFYRSTFEQILSDLGIGANLETHVVARLHSEDRADQRSLTSVLLEMGRVITSTIVDGWAGIFGRQPPAQEVELAAERDGAGAVLELRIKGPDGYYDLSERSLGFRWFFMFLLMTSFHGRDNPTQRPLFLLDEPASNLHSSAQAELLKSFEKLADRCYLVYTTHSQHLINIRWLDSAYVVKNAALGGDFGEYLSTRMATKTSISATRYRRFVAEHPDQTSYFQPVLDLLDYRPSLLEPVPSVVMVEGKTDYYAFRYAIDLLGVQSDLHLVPGTGAGSLGTLIRLHLGWGKSFLVLLDGDAEGQKQRTRYEEEFGPILDGRLVVFSDVCDDKTAEDVTGLFTPEDVKLIVAEIYPDPASRPSSKKALSQAIVELYALRRRIVLSGPTLASLEDVLGALARLQDDT
jgi:hypothetical protein